MRFALFIFFFISLLFNSNKSLGQEAFVPADTVNIKEIRPKSNKFYDPDRAALLSAVFPGLGQLYNRRYWKVPIAFIGVGVLYYVYNRNNDQYKSYKNARINLANPNANLKVDSDIQKQVDLIIEQRGAQEALRRLERGEASARRNRDFTIILAAGAYGMIIAEAYVDAHLKGFKISKDLSLKAKPSLQQPSYFSNTAYGVAFNLTFN